MRSALYWVVHAASIGDFLTTSRDNLSAPSSGFENKKKEEEEGTVRLPRNVGKKLPLRKTA